MKRISKTRISGRNNASPVNYKIVQPKNRTRNSVSMDVTPHQFRQAMRSARGGEPAKLYAILEQFYRIDDEIPAALGTLIAGVLAEEYDIVPDDDSQAAHDQAEVFTEMFRRLDLISLLEELLEWHYYGIRAAMPEWGSMNHGSSVYQMPLTWERLPDSWIYAKKEKRSDEYTTLFVGDDPYYTYPAGSILLGTSNKMPSFQDIDFTQFGQGLGCIRFAIMKYYDVEDWAAFNEAFATPLILGELLEGWKEPDKELLEEAVMRMGNDSRAVTTSRGKIHFPEANKYGSSNAFERFLEALNRIISVKLKSESQTDQMNRHGSNAAMITAYGIQLNVARKMARKLIQIIDRDIMRPAAQLNFNGNLLCSFSIKVKRVNDMVQQVKIDEGLQRMGVELSKKQILKRYGRVEAEDDDDKLDRPAVNLFGGV